MFANSIIEGRSADFVNTHNTMRESCLCGALLQLCANDDNETIYGKINVSLPIVEIKEGAPNEHQFGNKSEWSKGFNVTMGHCHKNVSLEMRKA